MDFMDCIIFTLHLVRVNLVNNCSCCLALALYGRTHTYRCLFLCKISTVAIDFFNQLVKLRNLVISKHVVLKVFRRNIK